jgi:hypothetical protein
VEGIIEAGSIPQRVTTNTAINLREARLRINCFNDEMPAGGRMESRSGSDLLVKSGLIVHNTG